MKSLIRLPEVQRRAALSRTEIWRRVNAGTFPRPVRTGPRAIAWVEEEIDHYVEAAISRRDQRLATSGGPR